MSGDGENSLQLYSNRGFAALFCRRSVRQRNVDFAAVSISAVGWNFFHLHGRRGIRLPLCGGTAGKDRRNVDYHKFRVSVSPALPPLCAAGQKIDGAGETVDYRGLG